MPHHGLVCGYDIDIGEVARLSEELAWVEALCGGGGRVLAKAFSFIGGAGGTPETWYAKPG